MRDASLTHFKGVPGAWTQHREGITYGGPFVMTTAAQMAEARRRYANGEMGQLGPYKG